MPRSDTDNDSIDITWEDTSKKAYTTGQTADLIRNIIQQAGNSITEATREAANELGDECAMWPVVVEQLLTPQC